MSNGNATTTITITGDARAMIAELQKVNAAQSATIEKFNQTGTAGEAAGEKAGRGLQKQKAMIESMKSPLERHNAKVAEMRALYEKGTVTQEQFSRGVLKSRTEMEKQNAAVDVGAKGMATWALAAGAVGTAFGAIVSAQRDALAENDKLVTQYDSMFRKFRIQGALTQLGGKDAQEKLFGMAEKNAVPVERATATATALVSSGFSVEDATGKAGEVMLQTMAASNLGKGDPAELAKSAGQFLSGAGMEKTGDNLQKAMIAMHRLFEGTDVQLADLSSLASKVAAAGGRLNMHETFATFDVLREVAGADQASTSWRSVVSRLQTAGANPEATKALKQMNLKPGDVDMVDERVGDVLDRLGAGLERVSEEKRPGILKNLFGEEAVAGASHLIANRGKLPGLVEKQKDATGYYKAVDTATSGPAAARQRLEVQRERALLTNDKGYGTRVAAADAMTLEQGASPMMNLIRKGVAGAVYTAASTVMDDRSAQDLAISGAYSGANKFSGLQAQPGEFMKAVDERAYSAEKGANWHVLPSMRQAPEWGTIRERPASVRGPLVERGSTPAEPENPYAVQQGIEAGVNTMMSDRFTAHYDESGFFGGTPTAGSDADKRRPERGTLYHSQMAMGRKRQALSGERRGLDELTARSAESRMPGVAMLEPVRGPLGELIEPEAAGPVARAQRPTQRPTQRAAAGPSVVAASDEAPRQHRTATTRGGLLVASDEQRAPREYAASAPGPVVRAAESSGELLSAVKTLVKHAEVTAKSNQSMERQQKQSASVTPPPPRFTTPPSARLSRGQSYPQSGV